MNTIIKLLACSLIFMFSGLNSAVYAAHGAGDNCKLDLPSPILEFTGTEDYEANGKLWTRYKLNITNRNKYPKELFRAAPDLPPCGLNKNSARTWIDIFESGNRIYGFCALSSPDQLNSIWFAKPRGSAPPKPVHVQLNDRSCDKKYTSNRIQFDQTIVNVDCDQGQSLKNAIAVVGRNGTVNIKGTCMESGPVTIPKSKSTITLAGAVDGTSVIDGNGSENPVLIVEGAKQVTIKNLTVVNGRIGILFTRKAGGKLIQVDATDNGDGIVADDGSYVKFDEVIASHNLSTGIKILNGSHARFMNLNKAENLCPKPVVKQPIETKILKQPFIDNITTQPIFKTTSLAIQSSAETAGDTTDTSTSIDVHNCSVVVESNGDIGVLVDGNSIIGADTNPTTLEIENCLLKISDLNDLGEMNGNQNTGLMITGAGNVATLGGIIQTEGNSLMGINIEKASTLALNSHASTSAEEIQSKVESIGNLYGMALDGSALNLNDATEILISDNKQYGVYVNFFQDFTCGEGQALIEFSNNGVDLGDTGSQKDIQYPFGNTTFVPEVCIAFNMTPANITDPAAGSTLSTNSQVFTFNDPDNRVFSLYVGSSPGDFDLGYYPGLNGSTSVEVTNLPEDGSNIYLTLYSFPHTLASLPTSNEDWLTQEYIYTAVNMTPAYITDPAAGSTLSSNSQVFTFNDPDNRVFSLYVGSTPGDFDLGYYPGLNGSTSVEVTNLPEDGSNIYFTLYSFPHTLASLPTSNEDWLTQEYTYTAVNITDPADE
jgi:hypothetical protein